MAKQLETDSLYLQKLQFDPSLKQGLMYWLFTNTRILLLGVLALIIAGIFAFTSLPRELNPEVEIPIVNVITSLPGANPLDIEELITTKIEKEVANIPAIDTVSSSSQDSVSVVTIQFSGTTDPDKALADVKERVDLVTDLPADATTPRVNKLDFNDQPIAQVALVGEVDQRSLTQIAKTIQARLEREGSIRRVDLAGEEEEEIVVSLRPEALASYGLSAAEVANSIRASNVTFPAGAITINQTEYQLTLDNSLTTIDQLRKIPISQGSSTIGLSEVADIYFQSVDSVVRLQYQSKENQKQNAIELAVYKTASATITGASEVMKQVIEDELRNFPQVSQKVIINTADEITNDFTNLGINFRDTVFLVFLVLFLFLGLRQAFVASLSIPLTFLSAFIIMQATGITLNFLSLFSLLLSLGLVVDDAIVVVQSAHRYSQKFSPIEMGLLVFRDFLVPIWTTTITTVWAFLPLLLATGIIGEFIKSIPIVVSATLLSSTAIAVLINLPLTVLLAKLEIPKRLKVLATLVVFFASLFVVWNLVGAAQVGFKIAAVVVWMILVVVFLTVRQSLWKTVTAKQKNVSWFTKFWKNKNIFETGVLDFTPVAAFYRKVLRKIITTKQRRYGIYALVAIFFFSSVGFLMTGLLRTEFFPKTDQNQVYIGVEGAAGSNETSTTILLQKLESTALTIEEVKETFVQTGQSVPSGLDGGASGAHTGFVTVLLEDDSNRKRTSIEVADQLREMVANEVGAKISVFELSGGPPAGADLQVNIKGDDLKELERISNEFVAILQDVPGAVNIASSLKQSPGQIKVSLDERELRERGLSAVEIGSWLRTALVGQESTDITVAGEEVDIIVSFADSSPSLDELKNMQLPSQFGSYTLAEVANFTLATSPISIDRLDQIRVVRVTAAADGISAPELLAAFSEPAAEVSLPLGYTWDVGGANEENNESVQSILLAMGLSVLLILVTMVWQLNSFRKSFLVLIVIPVAVAGVFFNFTMLRIPLSFPALIGVLALFGIVVNNSIMLVDKINQNIVFGLKFYDAVVDACASRIEPIFFTSLTTTIGLLPITISDPLWRGLGGAIIAGLSVSGLLVLFLLPAMYVELYAASEGEKTSHSPQKRSKK